MKKLCLIILAVTAAFISSVAISRGECVNLQEGQTYVHISEVRKAVYVQAPFGRIAFTLNRDPYPTIGIMSFSEIVTSATITSLTTGQSVTTRLFGGGAYNLSVPVFGNDAYEIVIETNAGTFCINVYVSALPDYEPGDPRIMLPIDDPRKI